MAAKQAGRTRRTLLKGMVAGGAALVTGRALSPEGVVASARAERARRPAGSTTARGGPTLQMLQHVTTGSQPKSVTSYPDGSRVVVCHFGRREGNNVGIYDADSLEQVGTVEFHGNAVESVFSPDGQTLYVSNFRRHVIHAIDPETYEIRGEVSVGRHPKWMVITADGSTLFAANWAGANVSMVDLEQMTETRRLDVGTCPRGMAITRDGTLYAAAFQDHVIRQFDAPDYEEVRHFDTCRFPRHLVLSPDDARLYHSCSSNRQLRWIDLETGRRTGIVPIGENPRTIDISLDGRWVVTADFDSSSVCLVDTEGLTHRRHDLRAADQIVGVTVLKSSPLRVFATSWNNSRLIVLEPEEAVPITIPEQQEAVVAEVAEPPAEDVEGRSLWSNVAGFFSER